MAGINNFVATRYDFQGLLSLKANETKTKEESREINAKVAAEFESMFLKLVTDSMRSSIEPLKSDLLKNDAMDLFDGMFYDEVSHQIANSQGLGLLEWLNDISDRREDKSS